MDALDKAVNLLNKKFGKSYLTYGGAVTYDDFERVSLGNVALNFAIGGGVPEGKVVTIAGKVSAGKTTSALSHIAVTQQKGGKVVYIDTEHALDLLWAQKFGVDPTKLLIAQANTIEEVTDTMEILLLTGEVDLIVFDSVAATPSKKELSDSAEQKSMGGIAKEVGLMMRKITQRLHDPTHPIKTRVLIINQLRDNVGCWGAPEYMPGGRQLVYQSDIVIWLRVGGQSSWIGGKDAPIGIKVDFRVSKNRTAPPLKIGSYELLFEGKINNKKALIEEAIKQGVVGKTGAWYFYKDEKSKINGLDEFTNGLTKEDLEMIGKETLQKIYEKNT